jgi:NAD(P)-dependent dehydrogenase (short-subunit alcohol dehydrogenase family)
LTTGGGEGIGEKVALILAGDGANVALADIAFSKVERAMSEVKALGSKAAGFQVDITKGNEVNGMVQKVKEEFGRIDILVNTPGRGERKSFIDSTKEDWDSSINLNLYGVLNVTKAVIGHMIEQRSGKIVSVVSDAAKVGEGRNCVYSAAKAGVAAFSKALAKEVGRYNINVNCISLGMMNTPASIRGREEMMKLMGAKEGETWEDVQKRALREYTIRRIGEPEDAANAICFLVSDRASWITGQIVSVSGGYTMIG